MSVASITKEKRIFTLKEAKELLPLVRKITEKTVAQVNACVECLESHSEEDLEFTEARSELDATVREWAENLEKLGCIVKGLWLVDFDNGQGYYCWSYPEHEIDHFHSYEEGFAERTRIC